MVHHARDVVPDDGGVGADGIESQGALAGHLAQALGEKLVGSGEALGEAPALPVGEEAVEALAVELRVFSTLFAEALEVPRSAPEVDGAADAVLREEDRAGILAEGA